jgi:AraC-like DNA-binding protein
VSQPIYRPLFLLTASEELEANLRQVVKRPFSVQRVSDWTSLKELLSSAPQTAVCFADPLVSIGTKGGLAEGLREIGRLYPLVAIVACVRVAACSADVLTTLHDWGVAELLDIEKELSPAAVSRRLSLVKTVWAQRLFKRALPRTLSARGRTLLHAVAEVAAEGGYVSELGELLGVYRGTVTRWCAAAGVPEPRRMFSWVKLLLAADLLDGDPQRSIENVARVCGFSSAASLKSSTKAFTGHSPSDLRAAGAFETVAGLARLEFRATREAARQSRQHKNSWFN